MQIQFTKAKCSNCAREFSRPCLGSTGYGEFIFTGELGTAFGYFVVPGNAVWDFLSDIIGPPPHDTKAALTRGARLQAGVAHFADAIDGQQLTNRIVCPHCHSSQPTYWDGEREGMREVIAVSHVAFNARSEGERRRLATAYFEGVAKG